MAKLANYRERLNQLKFVVLGDVALDQYIQGDVRRLSREAPVPVLLVNGGFYRPGGAANVAVNVASLGARVTLIGVIGQDLENARLIKTLEEGKVAYYFAKDGDRRTTRKVRILSGAHHIARCDYEDKHPISQLVCGEILEYLHESLKEADGLILQDYGDGVFSKELLLHLEEHVAPFIPTYYSPHPPMALDLRSTAFVVCNKGEAEDICGKFNSGTGYLVTKLRKHFGAKTAMVTDGKHGLTLLANGGRTHIAAERKEVCDVCGAGDTVLAAYAVCHALGLKASVCAKIASKAAGSVLGILGAAPVKWSEIKEVRW